MRREVIGVIIVISIMAAVAFSFLKGKPEEWSTVDYVNFYLKDNSTGSTFLGTVFAQVRGDERRVVLVGWVNITEKDFGGAFVGVPHGWRLISAETNYRDRNITNISDWMNILMTYDITSPVKYRIFIGPAGYDVFFCSQHPCGGGMGSVFVELIPEKDFEDLRLTLAVGRATRVLENGEKVLAVATTSKNVTVRL